MRWEGWELCSATTTHGDVVESSRRDGCSRDATRDDEDAGCVVNIVIIINAKRQATETYHLFSGPVGLSVCTWCMHVCMSLCNVSVVASNVVRRASSSSSDLINYIDLIAKPHACASSVFERNPTRDARGNMARLQNIDTVSLLIRLLLLLALLGVAV